jgi:hypothetical protein
LKGLIFMHTVSEALAKQWKALHDELSLAHQRNPPLADLFLGFIPKGFKDQPKRILFVGKATAGPFKQEQHQQCFNGSSAFWQFARDLSGAAGNTDEELTNVTWSNVSKIGVVNGNPGQNLELAQSALAAKTLRQEIRNCDPSIVVFACDSHGDETIYEATSAVRGGVNDFDTNSSDHGDFFSRGALDLGAERLPPMLWHKHPQFKTLERRAEWIEEFNRLLTT